MIRIFWASLRPKRLRVVTTGELGLDGEPTRGWMWLA